MIGFYILIYANSKRRGRLKLEQEYLADKGRFLKRKRQSQRRRLCLLQRRLIVKGG